MNHWNTINTSTNEKKIVKSKPFTVKLFLQINIIVVGNTTANALIVLLLKTFTFTKH